MKYVLKSKVTGMFLKSIDELYGPIWGQLPVKEYSFSTSDEAHSGIEEIQGLSKESLEVYNIESREQESDKRDRDAGKWKSINIRR